MESTGNPGYKTSEFWTMIFCNMVAFGLGHGWITSSMAQSATSAAPVIGAVILLIVPNIAYIFLRNILKARLGPLPTVPQLQDTLVPQTAPPGPSSPSYGPPSTGSVPPTADLPPGAV